MIEAILVERVDGIGEAGDPVYAEWDDGVWFVSNASNRSVTMTETEFDNLVDCSDGEYCIDDWDDDDWEDANDWEDD